MRAIGFKQSSDCVAVPLQDIHRKELLGWHPADLLEHVIDRAAAKARDQEIRDAKRAITCGVFHPFGIDPFLAMKLLQDEGLDVQLLPELPPERLLRVLARLPFPSGKLPLQGIPGLRAALAGEDAPLLQQDPYGDLFPASEYEKRGEDHTPSCDGGPAGKRT